MRIRQRLGTVLGIMNAMHNISTSGSTSLDVVAGPIGDALVATAIGIAVAVPAVLGFEKILKGNLGEFFCGRVIWSASPAR